jgi:hypothetical protein
MKFFSDLTGALSLYLTGRSSIYGALLPVYLLPTQAPANDFAVPGTALAGVFLPISFGQGWSPMDSRRVAFNIQVRGSVTP